MSREVEPHEGGPEGWEGLSAQWRAADERGAFAHVDVVEVRRREGAFARTIRRRNLGEIAAGALVMVGGVGIAQHAPTLLGQLGGAAMSAGAIVVSLVIVLRARNLPAPPPAAPTREVIAHERAQLERQARLLERVWVWYLAPLAPSVVLIYAESLVLALRRAGPARAEGVALGVGLFVATLAFFAFIGWLNARAAGQLRERMRTLPAEDDERQDGPAV